MYVFNFQPTMSPYSDKLLLQNCNNCMDMGMTECVRRSGTGSLQCITCEELRLECQFPGSPHIGKFYPYQSVLLSHQCIEPENIANHNRSNKQGTLVNYPTREHAPRPPFEITAENSEWKWDTTFKKTVLVSTTVFNDCSQH